MTFRCHFKIGILTWYESTGHKEAKLVKAFKVRVTQAKRHNVDTCTQIAIARKIGEVALSSLRQSSTK